MRQVYVRTRLSKRYFNGINFDGYPSIDVPWKKPKVFEIDDPVRLVEAFRLVWSDVPVEIIDVEQGNALADSWTLGYEI